MQSERVRAFFEGNPTFLFFVVLALGYLLGKLGPKGKKLGAVPGVLFVGLAFGHLGFRGGPGAQAFGFSIFIFAVGYQAGPRFFEVIRTDGARYFALALVIAVTGTVLAVIAARLIGFEPGISAGLLGGAMTTTPTLAAAQEALRAGNVTPPGGYPVEDAIDNVASAYAITYLFGVVGLMLVVRALPRIMKIDLSAAVAELQPETKVQPARAEDMARRCYRVVDAGDTVRAFEDAARGRLRVLKVLRDGAPLDFELDTPLAVADELLVLGEPSAMLAISTRGYDEIARPEALEKELETVEVIVQRPEVVGKTLGELKAGRLPAGGLALGLRRTRVELPMDDDLVLQRGDVVTLLVDPAHNARLVDYVGHVERDIEETDLFTFALGIAAGILIGTLTVKIAGVSIGLGSAGGLLTSGLVIGFLRAVNPSFGRVPGAALWLLMELGLLMFMTGVGLSAGRGVVSTLVSAGPALVLCGVGLTVVPVFVGWFFGSRVLHLNPALLLGGIVGSMTSGPTLKVVQEAAKSPAPALGYTGAYAFANVLLTIVGSVLPLFDL